MCLKKGTSLETLCSSPRRKADKVSPARNFILRDQKEEARRLFSRTKKKEFLKKKKKVTLVYNVLFEKHMRIEKGKSEPFFVFLRDIYWV